MAAHCGWAGGENKDFLSWSKSFLSPPSSQVLGAEGGLFPTGFGPGASGCPCTELLLNVQAPRSQARSQGASVDTTLQCQNLPPSSVLPTCRIPAQAEPLASMEETSPSAPSVLLHPHLQCAMGTGACGVASCHCTGIFRRAFHLLPTSAQHPWQDDATGFVSNGP